jgi:uncharacterized membrane protein YcaP (DUF421 family)
MFFNSWMDLLRVVVVGALAYFGLVLILRISGKRTLSKMNAFDFVVTVALGSILATVLLSKDVALAEGVTAFSTLILLQFIVAWLSVRSKLVRKMVKSNPTLLFYKGEILEDALTRERITKSEVEAAIRAQGMASFEEVEAVVLETDGSITVMSSSQNQSDSVLKSLHNFPEENSAPN